MSKDEKNGMIKQCEAEADELIDEMTRVLALVKIGAATHNDAARVLKNRAAKYGKIATLLVQLAKID